VARVIVLGGGIAGFSAAQELVERGFDVVVVEKTGIPGGKARSSPVMPAGPSPWKAEARYPAATPDKHVDWVPGEHGFRFFPGFYRHVVDSMSRIPTPGGMTAADHLVPVTRCGLTQYDKPTFNFPMRFPRTTADAGTALGALIASFSSITELTVPELAHFGSRVWQIMTSCQERRLAEYENIGWWEFIDADTHSKAYQKFLATGITRSLVAAKAETASTRTIGNIFIQLLLDILDPLVATSDRVLDGPTNQVWIYPWLQHLRAQGLTYQPETAVTELLCAGGRITGVRVEREGRSEILYGDYYLCAMPVERVAPLLTPALLAADPQLASLPQLAESNLEWMNGIQYYFRRPVRLVHGHMNHIDTEWALTSISQVDVWRPSTMDRYGPEVIQGILSVDVSDWLAPAPNGRTAMEHSREDVCVEVWRQLKRSVNTSGEEAILRDEDLIGWFIDSDIDRDPNEPSRLANAEPLLVNEKGTWALRPEAVTAIPNLFLASDYVRTHTDLATMEAANEAARRAVNGILEASHYGGERCRIWPLHEPLALAPFRQYDAMRFGMGLPWDPGVTTMGTAALRLADPLFVPIANAMSAIAPVAVKAERVLDQIEEFLPDTAIDAATQGLRDQLQQLRDGLESQIPVTALETAGTHAARLVGGHPSAPARAAGPEGFEERMAWYRGKAMAALADAIPRTGPVPLYEPMREFLARPGKGLRPALCLATCLAHGGDLDAALPSAAGLELLHNAFLVHDDIEDGSDTRRGLPTLHRIVGVPMAVTIGDTMNALAMRLFHGSRLPGHPDLAAQRFDDVEHLLLESLEGQALELGWIRDNNCGVTTDDYLELVLKKTAWYSFIHPMRLGALAGGVDAASLDRFHRFGFLMGAAFQIRDDVLNLVGDEGRYGKEIGGDLWEGKRTLALARTFSGVTGVQRDRLERFLSRPRESRLPRELLEIREIITAGGGIEWASAVADGLERAARDAFPGAYVGAHEGPDLAFIRQLMPYLSGRDS